VKWVRALILDLKVPRLGSFGIQQTHIADLAAKAAKASSMKANPIVLAPEELTEILEQAL
jgi:alcohol dehydrogenase class IV